MAKIELSEVAASYPRLIVPRVLLKYMGALEITVRKNLGATFHHFVYIEDARNECNAALAELLSPQEDAGGKPKMFLQGARRWRNGRDKFDKLLWVYEYSAVSLFRVTGHGAVNESVHFFTSRDGYDAARNSHKPIGWGTDET